MGFGSTAKKIQKVASMAEKTYGKVNEVVSDLEALRDDFEDTSDRVVELERELATQRAVLEALAEREGVDVEEVVADADVTVETGNGESADDAPATAE
ncbi:DUF5798 family protein [Haloarculaceae archaeon H-GB2-1]|nr:DUF5798 family protein [Haloarculaceae archaeon H-GB1-1]MEA5387621.1 DUF5798 family protein [Haloarculaceae archaeon H-GB11]MEA5409109.1 DUF5798 family protein [Haloarculaceae archaeon H-GB2-1]